MEISRSSTANFALPANGARKSPAAQRETLPAAQASSGSNPLPPEQRETPHRRAATAGGEVHRLAADLPRSSREALEAYLSQQASLEQETLQTVYQLAGFDQYT